MSYVENFFNGAKQLIDLLDKEKIEQIAATLSRIRKNNGRLFIIGVGGSAANCSHAVNDFRKICKIEAYAPTDNVAELTARTNDEGWDTTFSSWLECSNANDKDALMVFSVGGGNLEMNVSPNIVRALQYAEDCKMTILGIVGRDGGYTAKVGNNVIIIPSVSDELITPYSEAFQAVIWHCLTCHPKLSLNMNKWESLKK